MGEWVFHIGRYFKKRGGTLEDVPDPMCGYRAPDHPGDHKELMPRLDAEGMESHRHPDDAEHPAAGGAEFKLMHDGLLDNARGKFVPMQSVYVDLAHNWFAGSSKLNEHASKAKRNVTGGEDVFAHDNAVGFWTMVYTEGFHVGMGDPDTGVVHSFRGFNWYTLNKDDGDLKLPDPDGRPRKQCERESDMTNSPDENSPCTICGRTLLGWYKQEFPPAAGEAADAAKREEYCWWGQKLRSSPEHNHFKGASPSFAEQGESFADFAADGEVIFTDSGDSEKLQPKDRKLKPKDKNKPDIKVKVVITPDSASGEGAQAKVGIKPEITEPEIPEPEIPEPEIPKKDRVARTVSSQPLPSQPLPPPPAVEAAPSVEVPPQPEEQLPVEAEPAEEVPPVPEVSGECAADVCTDLHHCLEAQCGGCKHCDHRSTGRHFNDFLVNTLAKDGAGKIDEAKRQKIEAHVEQMKKTAVEHREQHGPGHPFHEEMLGLLTGWMGKIKDSEYVPRTGFRDAWMEAADWAQKGKAPAGHNAEQGPNFDLKYGPMNGKLESSPVPTWHFQDAKGETICKGESCMKDCPYSEEINNWDWRAFPPKDDSACKIPGLEVEQNDHTTDLVSSTESQSCGTCYAVASSSHLTSRLWIKYPEVRALWQNKDPNGEDIRISWGHASSCNAYNQGCDGGFPYWVMTGWSDHGAQSTACMADTPLPNSASGERESVPDQCTATCAEEHAWETPVDPATGAKIPGGGIGLFSWGYIGGAYGRCPVQVTKQGGAYDDPGDGLRINCEQYMKRELYRGGPIVVAIEPEGSFSIWRSGVLGAVGSEIGPHATGKNSILSPANARKLGLKDKEALGKVEGAVADIPDYLMSQYKNAPGGLLRMCPEMSEAEQGEWLDGKHCYHYEKVDHSVILVGWGVEDGEKYWLLKNSWGNNFGVEGVIKVIRGDNHLSMESIPVAADPQLTTAAEEGAKKALEKLRKQSLAEVDAPLTHGGENARKSFLNLGRVTIP